MTTATLRQELHQYIDNSDEKFLKMVLAMAKEYNEVDDLEEFTEEDIKELDELRAKRLSGQSKTYAWDEAKKIITRQV